MSSDTGCDRHYEHLARQMPCVCCFTTARPRDFHHATGHGRGKGQKTPSALGIPLCRQCHRLFHDLGRKTFAEKHGTDMELIERTRKMIQAAFPKYQLPELPDTRENIPAPHFHGWKPKEATQRPSSDTDTHLTPEQAAVSP